MRPNTTLYGKNDFYKINDRIQYLRDEDMNLVPLGKFEDVWWFVSGKRAEAESSSSLAKQTDISICILRIFLNKGSWFNKNKPVFIEVIFFLFLKGPLINSFSCVDYVNGVLCLTILK